MLESLKQVFASYGVPDYVWYPIMQKESGGNPNAHSPGNEDSRGLFQINLGAHPEYKSLNLYDPVVNATVAARDFIAPAYAQAIDKGLTNQQDITAYVWKNGIRPYWTEEKNQGIRKATADYLGMPIMSDAAGIIDSSNTGPTSKGFWENFFSFDGDVSPWLPGVGGNSGSDSGSMMGGVVQSIGSIAVGLVLIGLIVLSMFMVLRPGRA